MTTWNKDKKKNKLNYLRLDEFLSIAHIWRIMKLTAFFFLAGLLEVSAYGYSQNVSIHKQNIGLEDILIEINKQTGYSYSINNEVLRKAKRIDISVDNESIESVLDKSIKDQNLSYNIQNRIIIIRNKLSNGLSSNGKILVDVRGRILTEKGDPVSATVALKGQSSKAVATDQNGNFILKGISNDAILLISGINIEAKEERVNGRSDLGIVIVKAKIIENEEVIISNIGHTGFGDVKPNETTSSLAVIDKEKLQEQMSANIIDRLNGVTPSFLVNIGKVGPRGEPNSFLIRGLSTINAATDPLIVLDNFPYEGNIANINPDDVENITILKDAAATSIYGVKGGNGVIVITTKKGRFNQKLNIGINSNFSITDKPNLFYLPRISVSDYIDVEELLFNKGYFNNTISFAPYTPLTPAQEIFLSRRNGSITSLDSASQIGALKKIDSRTDFDKYFFSKALTQQFNVALSAGNENIAWYISGAYVKNLSNLKAKGDKINFRINNSYEPIKNLNINLGFYYTNDISLSGRSNPQNSVYRDAPYIKFADANGLPLSVTTRYRNSFTDTVGNGQLLNWKLYPLEDYKHDQTKMVREQLLATLGINYQIKKSISFSLDYQYQKESSNSERTSDEESFYARDLINRFTNLQVPLSLLPEHFPIPRGGILTTSNIASSAQSIRGQINFNDSWGEHSVTAIAGNEFREVLGGSSNVFTTYGYTKDPLAQTPVNFRTEFRQLLTGGVATIPGEPAVGYRSINRFISFYGNMSYAYKRKYTLSSSFRKDASNIFGLSTNDKWNPLWSVGVAWDISKEGFYNDLRKYFPLCRLRATWGYSGNLDLRKTALPQITYDTNIDIGVPRASLSSASNPDLRWEKSRQFNIGIDFEIIKRIITGSFEYYRKVGSDLYGDTPYDYTVFGGTSMLVKNVANMEGKGVDISLNISLFQRKDLKFDINILYNFNNSITTKYFGPSALSGTSILRKNGNEITPVVGKPLYAIAAYRWGGLDATGNPLGYLNGHLSADYATIITKSTSIYDPSVKYIGPANPTHFGSMASRFSFKGFYGSINIVYKFGYYFVRSSFSDYSLINYGIGHSEYANRWKNPGDELQTNVPSFNYPAPTGVDLGLRSAFYQNAEIQVHKAGNIKLQYLNLGYSFNNKSRMRNNPFKKVNVYVNIANLGILWKATKEDIDPDFPSSIPPSKTITIGIRTGS